jgi:hypothetical protein
LAPEDVLRAFFTARRQLTRDLNREDRLANREGRELDYGPFLRDLKAVLERYCTPKRRPQSEVLDWGTPEYDPKTERVLKVTSESPRRVVILTVKSDGIMDWKRRYVLLKQGGEWLIDSKQAMYSRKWEREPL